MCLQGAKGCTGLEGWVILDDAEPHDADDASRHVSLTARDDVYRRTPQTSALCSYDQAILNLNLASGGESPHLCVTPALWLGCRR